MLCFMMGFFSDKPYIWSKIAVFTAFVCHIPTSIYQWPGVYGIKNLVIPCYFISIFTHAYTAYQLNLNPYDPIILLKMSASLNIYVWVRISFTIFKYLQLFRGNEYTAAILCAGFITIPLIFGSYGNMLFPISILFYTYVIIPIYSYQYSYLSKEYTTSYQMPFIRMPDIRDNKEHVRTMKFCFSNGKCFVDHIHSIPTINNNNVSHNRENSNNIIITSSSSSNKNNNNSINNDKDDKLSIKIWKNKVLPCNDNDDNKKAELIFEVLNNHCHGNGVIDIQLLRDMMLGFGLLEYDLQNNPLFVYSNSHSSHNNSRNNNSSNSTSNSNHTKKIISENQNNNIKITENKSGNMHISNKNKMNGQFDCPTNSLLVTVSTAVRESVDSSDERPIVSKSTSATTVVVNLESFTQDWQFLWMFMFHALRLQLQRTV